MNVGQKFKFLGCDEFTVRRMKCEDCYFQAAIMSWSAKRKDNKQRTGIKEQFRLQRTWSLRESKWARERKSLYSIPISVGVNYVFNNCFITCFVCLKWNYFSRPSLNEFLFPGPKLRLKYQDSFIVIEHWLLRGSFVH